MLTCFRVVNHVEDGCLGGAYVKCEAWALWVETSTQRMPVEERKDAVGNSKHGGEQGPRIVVPEHNEAATGA